MIIHFAERMELEFLHHTGTKQIHVTSNPYFAFHDDVFPGFAKNVVAQQRFPPSFGRTSIIPDEFFTSLEELNHISTFEMNFYAKNKFQFNINFLKKSSIFQDTNILSLTFFDGSSFLSFGTYMNRSLWVDSNYFGGRFLLKSKINNLSELAFHFNPSNATESIVKIVEEQYNFK